MSLKRLSMIDEVLEPNQSIVIKYDGPNPSAAIDIIKTIAKRRFKISSKFWFEEGFVFVDIGPKYELFAHWEAKNKLDRYTRYSFRLLFHMHEDKKTKKGDFKLNIRPTIETSFAYRNILQRIFYKIFMRMFYYEQRRKYKEELKKWAEDYKEDLLDAFGVNAKELVEEI